ncbi:hypothetical protein CIB95_10710 [Lottiidibacillus patelloidae]|uniref:Polyketide cyclase n=1 Tax=Lottiidibacillus patelloidae TaxID=2670334 RepID=A0A263BU30_9BACI|nr:SRPBCC family protein [Lottiidibacillus patelloidae]OZM56686.1 hypothetical protein CIB95_10710 [Lottiidibacillus patelloidae]
MINVQSEVFINKDYKDVFSYIANFENNPLWQGGMISAKFTSEGPINVGSEYDQVAKFLGKQIVSKFRVVEYIENNKIKIESISGSFPIVVTRSVEPVDGGTKVSALVQGDSSGFFKIAEPIMKYMVSNSVKGDYKKLKKLLEN